MRRRKNTTRRRKQANEVTAGIARSLLMDEKVLPGTSEVRLQQRTITKGSLRILRKYSPVQESKDQSTDDKDGEKYSSPRHVPPLVVFVKKEVDAIAVERRSREYFGKVKSINQDDRHQDKCQVYKYGKFESVRTKARRRHLKKWREIR
eukprot:TRINITY_DN1026_c0_g2_i1.p2 TRINITY_DN1026_c0_g2~~TRINITY_DN1026_c0_g2_i1.p2  ORF type:complete len:149 (-),score=15.26 TRINITY_DN1026_c0_g2_i1:397-843(-)